MLLSRTPFIRFAASVIVGLALAGCESNDSVDSAQGGTNPPLGPAATKDCKTISPSIAFHSDGTGADPIGAPMGCASTTGFGAQEPHIRVGPNGHMLEIPAVLPFPLPSIMRMAVAQSVDQSASWQSMSPGGNEFQTNDNVIYIDRETGRAQLALCTGFGVYLVGETGLMTSRGSPAGYNNWSALLPMTPHVGAENSRFTSAPAPEGYPGPALGERMTYWCANTNPAGTSPPILARFCYRSFDGGESWERGATLLTAVAPQHPECGLNAEFMAAIDGYYPQGGPDGALWTIVRCGANRFLAKSTDEAATFPILHRADGSPVTLPGNGAGGPVSLDGSDELRVDTSGNLYLVQQDAGALLLYISRDDGLNWNPPFNMAAPAVRGASIAQWQVAAGYAPGEVAVSYLVPRSDGGFDGYITATHRALDANPVFYAARINPADTPMITPTAPGLDFIDVDMAPDGTPWAVFYSDCPSDDSDPYCATTSKDIVREGNAVSGPLSTTIGRLLW
jgi:hypothetical protein